MGKSIMGQLLDNIKNAAIRSKQPQGQVGGATENAFQSIQEMQGKAGTGAPSGQTNVQERLGISQQKSAQGAITDQLTQQATQAAVTEQQQAQQQNQFDTNQKMQARANDQDYQATIDNMYNELAQNYQKMDQQEREMAMEQLAFDQRLSDEQYVHGLQQRGQQARLEDQHAFQEELKKQVMGDNLARLERQFDERLAESARQDTHTLEMAQRNYQTAMDIFKAEAKDAADDAFWSGAGDLASAGIEAAGKSGLFDDIGNSISGLFDSETEGVSQGSSGIRPTVG